MNYSIFFNQSPYSLQKDEKEKLLNGFLSKLTKHHYNNCYEYKRILDALDYDLKESKKIADIPFLPVRLFKMENLFSISEAQINKTMLSSGTTGQSVSRIYIDKETSYNQSKVLTKIVSNFIGSKRIPMIIIDSPSVLKDRNMFSARGAGILGFSFFGKNKIYALNEKMELNHKKIIQFLEKHENKKIFLFGFTFIIYQHFIKELEKRNIKFDLSKSVLIHGGGWKKLENTSINSDEFQKMLNQYTGISYVYDYYGMVEQTGSIYMECEKGYLHSSIYSDIIIRRASDFTIANYGEKGIIQVLSVLPKSYPGHSLLTEDEGYILGEDDCECGRFGKYFKVSGRIKNAEIRGCSDTYE
ncbi:MAG: acyl-protein synthetase [Candidatus Marinimicrobia bacterium]|nr:acyl-protein synthetase [Candidatus Neomarinimicrobiota bacterium]|tara:strand:- start:14771 stop:15841 length:1071 start_codon:yes stop_codon:yes gene_type:complete